MRLKFSGRPIAVLLIAYLGWLAFVGSTSTQELLLGALCALFTMSVGILTWRAMGIPTGTRPSDLLPILRLPWALATDTCVVIAVLAKDLLGITRAPSHLYVAPFQMRCDGRGAMRSVLAVAFTSVSPNSIVIGVDPKGGQMIIHELAPAGVPIVARQLGAKP